MICKMDIDELLNIDRLAIFNRNIANCKQVGNQQAVYHENSFEQERILFQNYIYDLKEQVSYLKTTIDNVLKKDGI